MNLTKWKVIGGGGGSEDHFQRLLELTSSCLNILHPFVKITFVSKSYLVYVVYPDLRQRLYT